MRARTNVTSFNSSAPVLRARIISERIISGAIEVQRVEIFYNLKRLREAPANILSCDGNGAASLRKPPAWKPATGAPPLI